MAWHFLPRGESQGGHPGPAEDNSGCRLQVPSHGKSTEPQFPPVHLFHHLSELWSHLDTQGVLERDGSSTEAWRQDLSAWEFGDIVSKTNALTSGVATGILWVSLPGIPPK